jgi:hypothetical protein
MSGYRPFSFLFDISNYIEVLELNPSHVLTSYPFYVRISIILPPAAMYAK